MSTKVFNISLPVEMVEQADRLAKAQFRSRSEFIKEALRFYMKDTQVLDDLLAYGRERGKEAGISSEDQVFEIVS